MHAVNDINSNPEFKIAGGQIFHPSQELSLVKPLIISGSMIEDRFSLLINNPSNDTQNIHFIVFEKTETNSSVSGAIMKVMYFNSYDDEHVSNIGNPPLPATFNVTRNILESHTLYNTANGLIMGPGNHGQTIFSENQYITSSSESIDTNSFLLGLLVANGEALVVTYENGHFKTSTLGANGDLLTFD